jgi:hypothetical protein
MKIGRKLGSENKGVIESLEKFAYLPKRMTSGDIIWMEKYKETRTWNYNNPTIWHTIGYWGWQIVSRERS